MPFIIYIKVPVLVVSYTYELFSSHEYFHQLSNYTDFRGTVARSTSLVTGVYQSKLKKKSN